MSMRSRLPHALLFHGPPGIGKAQFVSSLCLALVCEMPDSDGHGCGRCRNCLLYAAGTHPDVLWVSIQDDATVIKIDQIRDLIDFTFLSRSFAAVKIAVILGADAMNTQAANSLLKTLEEPPANTVIILSCERISALPATVASRCHKLRFRIPERESAVGWLAGLGLEGDAEERLDAADGAPILAASRELDLTVRNRIAQILSLWRTAKLSAIDCAVQLDEIGVHAVLRSLALWLKASLTERLGSPAASNGQASVFAGLGPDGLLSLYDEVLSHRGRLSGTLNVRLMLEDLLCAWTQLQESDSSGALN